MVVEVQTDRAEMIRRRNCVRVTGEGTQPIVFAHGFGCDQAMWRWVAPAFEAQYKVICFDHVGCGRSDRTAYRRQRYESLEGYADDLYELCVALDLRRVILVGHSVSAMIAALAVRRDPARFERLVMVGPSPRYINDEGYTGGFDRRDVDELLDLMESNHVEWSQQLAPFAMGNPDRPELAREFANNLCNMDPFIARQFARVTFLSDYRALLPEIRLPTLIMQCTADAIAPIAVGEYMHAWIPDSRYVLMKATGHLPHLSAPQETVEVIMTWLRQPVGLRVA
jgi:sigma-B regulation protein RsbQ